jgi:uncharacterized protein YjbI with pentapeptide repeats
MMSRIRQVAQALLVIGLVVGVVSLIVWSDIRYHWSGYGGFTTPLTPEQILARQKSVWDWLALLIVPAVIALSAFGFGWLERRNERKIAEDRRIEDRRIADERLKEDRRIANERAEDAALEAYLRQMSTLLLDTKLRTTDANSEERDIARIWTLTVLQRLTGKRKGVVLRFLHESRLITGEESVISLYGADLDDAILEGANLAGADLDDANLAGANLAGANLAEASLAETILTGANLAGANLAEASLATVQLAGANLAGANLAEAILVGANLAGANLEGASLAGVNLGGANLVEANLVGTDLEGATFEDAYLGPANMKDALFSKQTIWPKDFDPLAAGAIHKD